MLLNIKISKVSNRYYFPWKLNTLKNIIRFSTAAFASLPQVQHALYRYLIRILGPVIRLFLSMRFQIYRHWCQCRWGWPNMVKRGMCHAKSSLRGQIKATAKTDRCPVGGKELQRETFLLVLLQFLSLYKIMQQICAFPIFLLSTEPK